MGDLEKQEPVETARLTNDGGADNECYTKEELLKLSSTPCWNMTRRILLALFWILWCGAIVWSVIIVVKAPKCKAEPNQTWFTAGGCAVVETNAENAVADVKALEAGKYSAIVMSGVLGGFKALQANYNQGDLLETMTNLKNAALTKNSKVIHMIDLADGELNENSYSEFSGYLNFDDTTDGIIYKNAKKAEVDAIRSGNPSYDIFYEINDPSIVMTDRQENEYFYQQFSNLEAATEFLAKTMKEENGTISEVVETLWNGGDGVDADSPSDAALYSAVLPGGFIIPGGNDKYQALITLRGEYHSLRAITGAEIALEGASVKRKFDLRPAVLLSNEAQDEEKWESIYSNTTQTQFQIYKEIL
jgi:hypothetical protein